MGQIWIQMSFCGLRQKMKLGQVCRRSRRVIGWLLLLYHVLYSLYEHDQRNVGGRRKFSQSSFSPLSVQRATLPSWLRGLTRLLSLLVCLGPWNSLNSLDKKYLCSADRFSDCNAALMEFSLAQQLAFVLFSLCFHEIFIFAFMCLSVSWNKKTNTWKQRFKKEI